MELATSLFERAQISRGLGTAATGGYANANQIGFFTSNAVGSPLWANLYYIAITRPREEVLDHYLRCHRTFALITFPAATLLAIATPTVIPLFFGEIWRSNVGSIIVMVLACPWGNLGVLYSAILYARNQGRIVLGLQAAIIAFRILSLLLLWPRGVLVLSMVLALSNIGQYAVTLLLLSPLVGNRRMDLVRAIAAPLFASAVMAGAMLMLLPTGPGLVQLVLAGMLGGLFYMATLLIVDQQRTGGDLRAILALLNRRAATA